MQFNTYFKILNTYFEIRCLLQTCPKILYTFGKKYTLVLFQTEVKFVCRTGRKSFTLALRSDKFFISLCEGDSIMKYNYYSLLLLLPDICWSSYREISASMELDPVPITISSRLLIELFTMANCRITSITLVF